MDKNAVKLKWSVTLIPESPPIIAKANAAGFRMKSLFGYSQNFSVASKAASSYPLSVYKKLETANCPPSGDVVCVEMNNASYGQLRSHIQPGTIGISFKYAGSVYPTVNSVTEGSSAAAASIEVGDQILSVDGVPAPMVGRIRLLKLLRGSDGSRVNVSIARHGSSKDYVLQRVSSPAQNVPVPPIQNFDYVIPVRGNPFFLREAAERAPLVVEFYKTTSDKRIDDFIANNADLNSDQVSNIDMFGVGVPVAVKLAVDLRKLQVIRFDLDDARNKTLYESLGLDGVPSYVFVLSAKEFLVDDLDIIRSRLADDELFSKMKSCVLFREIEPEQ